MLGQNYSPHCALTAVKTADQELINGMNYMQNEFLFCDLLGIIN
jgi:hypothetical protein